MGDLCRYRDRVQTWRERYPPRQATPPRTAQQYQARLGRSQRAVEETDSPQTRPQTRAGGERGEREEGEEGEGASAGEGGPSRSVVLI
jgi:hypothetical protein